MLQNLCLCDVEAILLQCTLGTVSNCEMTSLVFASKCVRLQEKKTCWNLGPPGPGANGQQRLSLALVYTCNKRLFFS